MKSITTRRLNGNMSCSSTITLDNVLYAAVTRCYKKRVTFALIDEDGKSIHVVNKRALDREFWTQRMAAAAHRSFFSSLNVES